MAGQTKKFRAEMAQLMDIIVHSLYSNKEVFLRELISNAVDAIDKVRFLGLTQPAVIEDNSEWRVTVRADEAAGTLTVSDNGIGMSPESIVEELGVIAKSGAKEFLESLKAADAANRPELIGQFGVGFYASFMVADEVTVVSRQAGDPHNAVRWTSQGQGTYRVEPAVKEQRGTEVTLKLKDDAKEFLDPWRLRAIVRKFSDFVEHPIALEYEKEAEGKKEWASETLNSQKAIWLRAKADIKDEEYAEFYKHLSRDHEPPLKTVHYVAEGQMEFRALLFVPARKPPFFFSADPLRRGPHLYVKRVFITDSAEELLPPYLRFVRGVVDSSDLPLNVSREMMQDNPTIRKINKALTNRLLQALAELAQEEPEKYGDFFREWGTVLKAGVHSDMENRDRLADLLRYESLKTERGKTISLAQYVEGMKEGQSEIYYLTGMSREQLERSPHLEAFRARDWDVLLMTDPMDEWVVAALHEYKEKHFKAVDRGALPDEQPAAEREAAQKQYEGLLALLKDKIPEVKEVRLSSRLKESAAVLVTAEGQLGPHLEMILKQLGQENVPTGERILELNPDHAAVQATRALFDKDAADSRLGDYARLLYEQALLAEGSRLPDPVGFAARVNALIAKDAGG